MIAIYGVRGSIHHRHKYVTTKADAESWFGECRAWTEARHPAAIGQPTEVMADGLALDIKGPNGMPAYPEADPIVRLNREREAMGLCRHCGGRVPCWSEFGDVAAGVQHTRRSIKARKAGAR